MDTITITEAQPIVVTVYAQTLYGGARSYSCDEHRTGNHKPGTTEEQALDAAAVCWFDTAHGAVVTAAEADAMVRGVR